VIFVALSFFSLIAHMGVGSGWQEGRGGRRRSPHKFSLMIPLMCFSPSTRFVKTSLLSQFIVFLCWAG